MLFHLWKVKIGEGPPEGNGLERHKLLLQKLGIDLGSSTAWQNLTDAAKIRNCLLHVNGRVDLLRKPAEVERVIKRLSGNIAVDKTA